MAKWKDGKDMTLDEAVIFLVSNGYGEPLIRNMIRIRGIASAEELLGKFKEKPRQKDEKIPWDKD